MMKCQFCKTIFPDKEELQSHLVSSCPAIEGENYDGDLHRTEVVIKWMSGVDEEVSSTRNIYVLLSDIDDQIVLKFTDGGGALNCYQSQISMHIGQYNWTVGD